MSRLNRRLEKKLFKEGVFLFLLSAGALLAFFVVLLPLLINFSLFINNFKPAPIVQKKANIIQAPHLDSPFEATNSANIKLSGSAIEGQTVVLWQNDKETDKLQVLKDGLFNFDVILKEGENTFYALVRDADQESPHSDILKVSFIKNGPKIEVTDPSDNAEFKGKSKQTISLKGKTENAKSLTVNNRLIVLNQNGTFETNYNLQDGDNLLKFEVTDIAGNKTTLERTVKFSSN